MKIKAGKKIWFLFSLLGLAVCVTLVSIHVIADDSCLYLNSQGEQTVFSLAAPLIPSNKTISTNNIYFSFFKVMEDNFWQGNLVRFGISDEGEIIDKYGNPAFNPDRTLKEDAVPFWQTKDWADPTKTNYVSNADRNIYTFLGSSTDLENPDNNFSTSNSLLTDAVLFIDSTNPSEPTRDEVINFIRGADVFDQDNDGDFTENRPVITGDILHSQPTVYPYKSADGSIKTVIFFGSNDGMLHAVLDSQIDDEGNETIFGQELWAFIPPDLLHKLKDLLGTGNHPYFVDSSPKIYVKDTNGDGILDPSHDDQLILICGERKGGSSYFALDVTDPESPKYLWRIGPLDDTALLSLPPSTAPVQIISELGQSWSEPQFALVKTSDDDNDGTPVFFIGGGFSEDNSTGKAIIAVNVLDGSVLKIFKNSPTGIAGMDYAVASTVLVVDEDFNGFADKVYVGDLGGQVWRLGKFTDDKGDPLPFPEADENIANWTAHILFKANDPGSPGFTRKFFSPPSVTFEKDYDLLFIGSGDVESPCAGTGQDRVYAIQDYHDFVTLRELDLVDVTTPPPTPELDTGNSDVDENGHVDRGWFIKLSEGEKVLASPLVFEKIVYFTTFTPDPDGGIARLYAVNYKTGAPALFSDGNNDTLSIVIGVGPSPRPAILIKESLQRLFVSINTPSEATGQLGPGLLEITPPASVGMLHYLWWMIL